MKTCTRCRQLKHPRDYSWSDKRHTRLMSRCKQCRAELRREWYHSLTGEARIKFLEYARVQSMERRVAKRRGMIYN